MSNNGNNYSNNGYLWIQGNIRGSGCLIYGVTSGIRDFLRTNFRIEDTTNGYHISATPTVIINFLATRGYQIKETTSIDHFNLLWTLQPQTLN